MFDSNLLRELQRYIDIRLIKPDPHACYSSNYIEKNICEERTNIELENYISRKRMPTFNQMLFNFIDKKGAVDSEIYKKAGIDRRHFSKIRSNPDYHLGKSAAIALALALELSKDETNSLLATAGYSLSDSDTFDLVIQFCIEKNIYDINDVNEALDYFSLKPLGV